MLLSHSDYLGIRQLPFLKNLLLVEHEKPPGEGDNSMWLVKYSNISGRIRGRMC